MTHTDQRTHYTNLTAKALQAYNEAMQNRTINLTTLLHAQRTYYACYSRAVRLTYVKPVADMYRARKLRQRVTNNKRHHLYTPNAWRTAWDRADYMREHYIALANEYHEQQHIPHPPLDKLDDNGNPVLIWNQDTFQWQTQPPPQSVKKP